MGVIACLTVSSSYLSVRLSGRPSACLSVCLSWLAAFCTGVTAMVLLIPVSL